MVAVALAATVHAEFISRSWSSQVTYAQPSFAQPSVGGEGTGWQVDVALAGSLATAPSLAEAAGAVGQFGWYDGYGYDVPGFNFDAVENDAVVMRLFNAGAKAGATHYLDSVAIVLPDFDDGVPPAAGALNVTFDFAGAQWQAIPEPTTIGLMGIAGLGMYLARRKKRS